MKIKSAMTTLGLASLSLGRTQASGRNHFRVMQEHLQEDLPKAKTPTCAWAQVTSWCSILFLLAKPWNQLKQELGPNSTGSFALGQFICTSSGCTSPLEDRSLTWSLPGATPSLVDTARPWNLKQQCFELLPECGQFPFFGSLISHL